MVVVLSAPFGFDEDEKEDVVAEDIVVVVVGGGASRCQMNDFLYLE